MNQLKKERKEYSGTQDSSSLLEDDILYDEEEEESESDGNDSGDGSDCSNGCLIRFRYEMLDNDLQKDIMVVMALEQINKVIRVDEARLLLLVNIRTHDKHKETAVMLEINNLLSEGEIVHVGGGVYQICEE
jgi:hypothetical protein